MKVSIIRIKPQDTLNIIIDRLKNALNQRVFMIIQEGNDILYSEIGLETLFKKSLEAGKELIVSVPDNRSEELARKVGLVATTEQDVFTLDYKLWQKAHELLVNYKTYALYNKDNSLNLISGPEGEPANRVGPASSSSDTNSEAVEQKDTLKPKATKLVGIDFSNSVADKQKDTKKAKKTLKFTSQNKVVLPNSKPLKHNGSTKKHINVKLIIGLILFSTIALLGIIFWIYYRFFTKVYIYFTLPRVTMSKTYVVTGELGIEGAILASKKFELKEYTKEVSGHLIEKATEKQTDGTYATGTVVVTNNDTTPIDITVGMVFVSGDKQYKSTTAATIEPGESASISVQAVDYGDSYNLAANQVFTIQGLNKAYSATNPAAFSGGSLREYTVVSQKEVDEAIKKLKDQLLEQAKEGLEDIYKEDDYYLIKDSVKDITPKDMKYTVNPKVGEEATEFTVQGSVKIRALYYHEPSLRALIKQLLIEDYKKGRKLNEKVIIKLEDFSYHIVKIKVLDDKHVQFTVNAKASVVPSVDFNSFKKQVLGLDLPDLTNKIEEEYNTLVLKYRVVYIPDWMPDFLKKVPRNPNRIIIVIDYTEQK